MPCHAMRGTATDEQRQGTDKAAEAACQLQQQAVGPLFWSDATAEG